MPASTRAANQNLPPVGTLQEDWFSQREMTGNWGGLRSDLEQYGVLIRGRYVAEMAGDPAGGRAQGFRYAHEIMFDADIDFLKFTGLDLGDLPGPGDVDPHEASLRRRSGPVQVGRTG